MTDERGRKRNGLFGPARPRCFSGDFLTFRGTQFLRPRLTALETPSAPQLHGGLIAVIFSAILYLPRRNIDDELAELDCVARTLETLCRHVVDYRENSATAQLA